MSSRKTVLITGCSDGGLGAALAIAFHKANWRVLATARNTSKMASLKALGIELLELDVSSDASLQACVKTVTEITNNKLDMLLNNAGGGYSMPTSDVDLNSVRAVFELNVFAVVRTIQLFLPLLMENRSGAMIVNHTSSASIISGPFTPAYHASKAAMASFSDAMRLELAPFGIKVIDMKTAKVLSNFFGNISANNHSTKLPEDSIYAFAKDIVDHFLSGVTLHDDKAQKPDKWAANVVKDLTRKHPPNVLWRGAMGTAAWMITFMPSWLSDIAIKQASGLDKIEARLAKQKKNQ